jgi:predicted small secreted protein
MYGKINGRTRCGYTSSSKYRDGRNNSLKWKSFIYGLTLGLAATYFVKRAINEKTYVSSELVLNKVKKMFKAQGPVHGSWIMTTPEPYTKSALQTKVYRGGISRTVSDGVEQYEFIADAYTGAIMDVYKI